MLGLQAVKLFGKVFGGLVRRSVSLGISLRFQKAMSNLQAFFSPSTGRQRQMEFVASLVFRASSRTGRITQINPVLKTTITKKNKGSRRTRLG